MAGSKRWFRYRTDAGTDISVNLDESNSEATCGGERLMPPRTAAHPLKSAGFQLRYANAEAPAPPSVAPAAANQTVKRRFPIGNPLALAQAQAGSPIIAPIYPGLTAANWTITSIRGEKSKVPPALNTGAGDSGLDDADQGRDG